MFYGGMSNATSTLVFSGPYTEDDFDTGAGSIIMGDVITGLKVFRDELFVFCESSIYKIAGTSSSNFAKAEVAKGIGTLAHHSIQEIGGDILFLGPDGIRSLSATDKIGDFGLAVTSKQIQDEVTNFVNRNTSFSSLVIREKELLYLFQTSYERMVTEPTFCALLFNVQSTRARWAFCGNFSNTFTQ